MSETSTTVICILVLIPGSLVTVFNIFFAREFQDLVGEAISVNTIDPGFCHSELRRHVTGDLAISMQTAVDAIGYTSEEGARSLVYGLVAEQQNEEAVRGKYLSRMKAAETSEFSNGKEGKEVQAKLWVRTRSWGSRRASADKHFCSARSLTFLRRWMVRLVES